MPNPFTELPKEIFYHIFDHIPLKELIKYSTVDKKFKEVIFGYLLQELEIKDIICGVNFSIILLKNGRVLAVGDNQKGQLGLGANCKKSFVPQEILNIERIEQVSVGFSHSVMLDKNGNIWVMGDNSDQQLPIDPSIKNVFIPQEVLNHNKIKSIVAKDFTTSFLTHSNEFLNFGNLQLKPYVFNNTFVLSPDWVDIPTNLDIIDLSVATEHALILTKSKEVYGIGINENGSLGLGASYIHFPTWTKLAENVKKIQTMPLGSILLTEKNELMVSGMNNNGQLAPTEEMIIPQFKTVGTGVKQFAAGDFHTFYLDLSNQLYAMGSNEDRQLGLDSHLTSPLPVNNFLIFRKKNARAESKKHTFGCIGLFFKETNSKDRCTDADDLSNSYSW